MNNQFKSIFSSYFDTNCKYSVDKDVNSIICITCCDSRVKPSLIFGDISDKVFMIRNIAGIIPKYSKQNDTISAIEFAINTFSITHAIILSHTLCTGMINAMMLDEKHPVSSVNNYLEKINNLTGGLKIDNFEKYQELIMQSSLKNLEYLIEKNNKQNIEVIGSSIDIDNGDLKMFNKNKFIFE